MLTSLLIEELRLTFLMPELDKQDRTGLRTWIEINRKAIKHNFGVFKKLIPKKTKLMAVVKSNAYGHGLIDFSKEVERLGADFLGVDSMTEARALRREGVKLPILVLGYTMPELFNEAANHNISLTVSTFETLTAIKRAKLTKPLKIHIKVDTGMHRQGFLHADMKKVLANLQPTTYNQSVTTSLQLKVEGLFTHFAAAKNPAFPRDTLDQIAEFKEWIKEFKKAGLSPVVHAAATSGVMLFPQSHFDMVRIGIGLYGLWPTKDVKEYLRGRVVLKPALIWKSLITELKRVPKGSRIGYDLTETVARDSKIAVVPIGYWHGYPRDLSSIGRVIVNNKECKVLGRVSMDILTIDASNAGKVKVGDKAVIIGPDSSLSASAEGISNILDVSWYEVVTRINPLIRRIYT